MQNPGENAPRECGLSSFRGERSESPESIATIGSMDSGPAPSGASGMTTVAV